MELFNTFIEQSTLMLTGVLIAFISSIIYRVTPIGFKSVGKYRSKEGAIFIYLISAISLGLFTPFIYQLSYIIIQFFSILSIIGLLIFLANFIINQSIASWKHTTPKTLIIYFFSLFLFIFGYYFNNIT